MPVETLRWHDGALVILDQRLLPGREEYRALGTVREVCDAIKTLAVRGAPAIGVAAAYGVAVAARENTDHAFVAESMAHLGATRPTAVNLFHALDTMAGVLDDAFSSADPAARILDAANDYRKEDDRICRELSRHGAELLSDGDTVLTHCNAGGLATAGWGTALGVVYAAVEEGKKISVIADETRPLLQGGRLTAWELAQNHIPVTVITDGMASVVLREGRVDHVIVGADRIAANGDVANKIGTYGLSIAAREHGVPFHVAAPLSTFDFSLASGTGIPIEERDPAEIWHLWADNGIAGVDYYNPSFDVTPAANIATVVCEEGRVTPSTEALAPWAEIWRERYGRLAGRRTGDSC